jgi:hypothetical protein
MLMLAGAFTPGLAAPPDVGVLAFEDFELLQAVKTRAALARPATR